MSVFLSSHCTMCLPFSPDRHEESNPSFGTKRSDVQSCVLCLNSYPDFLFRISQTYHFRGFFFFLLVICTACSYFMLCFTHICIILISPVRLHLNTLPPPPFFFINDCAGCLSHLSQALFLSLPAFLLLCLESIITECVILILIFFLLSSSPFFKFFFICFSFCECLEMLLLLTFRAYRQS